MIHRYPTRAIAPDYIRAGLGMAATWGPMVWMNLPWVANLLLGALGAMFTLFAWQAWRCHRQRIEVTGEGISVSGGGRLAWEELNALPWVYGARLVGGGFGGGILALVEPALVLEKLDEILAAYRRDTGHAPSWELVQSGDGARFVLAGQAPRALEDWLG